MTDLFPYCIMAWPAMPLLIGWLLDLLLGDPAQLPHPVVLFGKAIAKGEYWLNRGRQRKLKGGMMSVALVTATYAAAWYLLRWLDTMPPLLGMGIQAVFIFYCLAGTTLAREVRNVFTALDCSLEDGRRQVARIVGRDTSGLSGQGVRTAALETLAENLSDGVIAPLFWYALLGVPGMLAYKMVNTLDSMIGYHTGRYVDFGCFAARMDDAANYIPARLTALLMLVVSGRLPLAGFVMKWGHQHASPNSGWPEAALAGILNCRFGGPHYYFGEYFEKPYIGENGRMLDTGDMKTAIRINRCTEILMVAAVALSLIIIR